MRIRQPATLLIILALVASAACARAVRPSMFAAAPAAARATEPPCRGCSALPMSNELADAIRTRVADLKARGGDCQAYGEVLERSLADGRITVRPYMWRVGTNLASATARWDGAMEVAREIDTLNVGVRTIDDVVWSAEHEAVHVAFHIASGHELDEVAVNRQVSACRPQAATSLRAAR